MTNPKRFVGYTAQDGALRTPPLRRDGTPKVQYVLHCSICGAVFFARNHWARYCGGACRQKAYRRRQRMNRRAREMSNRIKQLRMDI